MNYAEGASSGLLGSGFAQGTAELAWLAETAETELAELAGQPASQPAGGLACSPPQQAGKPDSWLAG